VILQLEGALLIVSHKMVGADLQRLLAAHQQPDLARIPVLQQLHIA